MKQLVTATFVNAKNFGPYMPGQSYELLIGREGSGPFIETTIYNKQTEKVTGVYHSQADFDADWDEVQPVKNNP